MIRERLMQMPWISNNGVMKYKPSKIYVKSDLPTYMEFVDFINSKNYIYDVNDENEKDMYWEVDKKKWLITVCCNQINKMFFEDGLREKAMHLLKEHNSVDRIIDLRAMIHCGGDNYSSIHDVSKSHSVTDYPPNVYYVKKALKDPFLATVDTARRTEVTNWERMELVLLEASVNNDERQWTHSVIDDEYWIHMIVTHIMK